MAKDDIPVPHCSILCSGALPGGVCWGPREVGRQGTYVLRSVAGAGVLMSCPPEYPPDSVQIIIHSTTYLSIYLGSTTISY